MYFSGFIFNESQLFPTGRALINLKRCTPFFDDAVLQLQVNRNRLHALSSGDLKGCKVDLKQCLG